MRVLAEAHGQAGWPALALLIAVKLLSGMLEYRDGGRDGSGTVPAVPGIAAAVAAPRLPAEKGTAKAVGRQAPPGDRTGTVPGIADLLPAARAARDDLTSDGLPVTRDAIASWLRQAGHPVRNDRLTPVMRALRSDAAA